MEKNELRRIIRERKASHSAEDLAKMSEAVCRSLMNDGAWRAAGVVLLYHALSDEVDTDMLIRSAEMQNKTVLLPVVVGDDLELRLYEGKESLLPGPFGILEPMGPVFPESKYHMIDFAVIPGMAFDSHCNRLGRGKGYYDRLLPRLINAMKIGVCFPFQFIEAIPSEPHDVKVNEVVSGVAPMSLGWQK